MRVNKSVSDKTVLSSAVINKPKANHQTLAIAKLKGYKTCQIDKNIHTKYLRSCNKKPTKFENWTLSSKDEQKQYITHIGQIIQHEKANTDSKPFGNKREGKLKFKLYHPSIYHYPQARKKYFCQVVDSYFMKSTIPVQNTFDKYKVTNKNNHTVYGNNSLNTRLLTEPYRPRTTGRNRKLSSKAISKHYGINVINQLSNVNQPQQSYGKTFTPSLKKLKPKLKIASATAYASFGMSQKTKRSKNLAKLHINLNTTTSISYDNISNEDQSKQKETFSQSESIPKSGTVSRHGQSMSIKKHIQNSLMIKLKQKLTKIPQSLLQQIQQRLNQQKIIINQQSLKNKIISQQQMFRILSIMIRQSSTLRQYYGHQIRIKQYKQDIISKQMASKIQKIIPFQVTNLWNPLLKTAKARLNQGNLFYSPFCKSLREELFLFKVNQKDGGLSYTIHTTSNYYKLFENNCEYFRDIIISIAEDLIKMRGSLINNNISLDNLYRLEEKCIKIGDWGYSAMCRRLFVVGKQIALKDQPILTIQEIQGNQENAAKNYKWLISPQNLPPQIIECLMENKYESIWDKDDSPEVWSLGVMIFELLTCVPVWMPCPTVAWHKAARVGYFYDPLKRLSSIYQLQTRIPSILTRWFRDEKTFISNNKIHSQILYLMKQMLLINPKLRPKPQQIIRRLKNID